MKHVYTLLVSIFALFSQFSYSETFQTVSNPIKHLLKLADVTSSDVAIFFEVDMNQDGLPELFLSSRALSNGKMGYFFDLYVNTGANYKFYKNNYITLRYNRLAITHDPNAPIVVFYDNTAWAYHLNQSNVLEEEKVFSTYCLNNKAKHSNEIFESLLAATGLEHPLVKTNILAAVKIFDERIAKRKTPKKHCEQKLITKRKPFQISSDGKLTRLVWKFKIELPIGSAIISSPAIFDDVVCFGDDDGSFYAVNIKAGEKKWKFKTNKPIYSSPIIFNDMVYFGSNDDYLYAINIKTGKEKWKFKTDGGVESSPVISNGVIYFGSNDGHLYAVNIETGKEKWRFKTKERVGSSPIIFDGMIYFGSDDNHLYSVNVKTGQEKWKFKTEKAVYSSPVISNGVVYFGSDDGYLYAVNIKTVQEKWKFKTKGRVESSPVIFDGVICFGSHDGHLYVVNVKTGQEKWKFKTKEAVFSSPAISNGVVYFGSLDGYLYAVNLETGQEKWRFKTEKAVYSSPIISGGVVYFGSHDGCLYAVHKKRIN